MNVLVTGASRGIGLELVRQLLDRGDKVIATARHPEDSPLAELKGRDGLTVLALDVDDDASVQAAAEALSGEAIDVLVNNAGVIGAKGAVPEVDLDDVLDTFRINAVAPLRVTQAFKPHTDRGRDKKLIFLTSKMGSIADNASGGRHAYRMSKAALNMLVKGLAVDLAPEGYTTLAVHPGWVQTDMGGPNAIHGLQESVRNLIGLIDDLGPDRSGEMWGAMERRIPW